VVVVRHDAGGCGRSDTIEIYRIRDGRTHRVWRLTPGPNSGSFTFTCLGPSRHDPCHPQVLENRRAIVGEFRSTDTSRVVPVAIYQADDSNKIAALIARPPRARGARPTDPQAEQARASTGRMTSLIDTNTTTSEQAATGMPSCQRGVNCVRAHAANAVVVLPPRGDRGALVVTGYITAGASDTPRKLSVRAAQICFSGLAPGLDHPCRTSSSGHARTVRVTLHRGELPGHALRRAWTHVMATGSAACA
jgi:hypothetical protein